MKNKITKEELFKKYKNDFACRVFYKGKKDYVSYSNTKHVDWKKVHRITVVFDSPKYHHDGRDGHKRDGATYLLV